MSSPGDTVEVLLEELLARKNSVITLDELGEAIGTRAFGADKVEALMTRLESQGVRIVSDDGESLAVMLKQVLLTARALASEGKKPSPTAIAERSGLSARAVRVALLYAHVLEG